MSSERQRHIRWVKIALIGAGGAVALALVGTWMMHLYREDVARAVRDAQIAGEGEVEVSADPAAATARAHEESRRRELERRENQHLFEPDRYAPLTSDEAEELVALRERDASRKK